MNPHFINTGILALAFLVLFSVAELLYHRFNFKAEVTRKIVHICTGVLTLLFPAMLENHWFVLALCSSFLIILLASLALKMLPSINAVDRKTSGSILYPVIVYGCFLLYQEYGNIILYYIPILTLAICDPIAALVGKKFPWKAYTTFGHQKTLSGSIGFFIASFFLSLILLAIFINVPYSSSVIIAFCIALTTAFAEAITHRGLDNLSIPAAAIATILLFHHLTSLLCLN